MKEFFFGGENFIGLTSLLTNICNKPSETKKTETNYQENKLCEEFCTFLQQRLSGQKPTYATWIRNFVKNHPDYKQDSVVSKVN